MEYYLAVNKKEVLPFVAVWIDMKDIILSEISQSGKQIPYDFTHMWNLMNKLN